MSNIINKIPIKDDKKAEAFDFIIDNAFRSGFGTLSKTELDSILFAGLMKFGEKQDITNLELSKVLQITQRRIQNLRESVSVKYLQINAEEAIDEFIDKLEYAKRDDKYIDVPINDVAVKNEIEGILDKNNILLHSQLNPKIFRIRIDDLMEIIILFETIRDVNLKLEDIKQNIIEKVKASDDILLDKYGIEFHNDDEIYPTLKDKLLKSGVDISLELIKLLIPGGGVAAIIIDKLMKNFGVLQNV